MNFELGVYVGLAEIRQELGRVERTGGFRLRLGKGGRLTLMARGTGGAYSP